MFSGSDLMTEIPVQQGCSGCEPWALPVTLLAGERGWAEVALCVHCCTSRNLSRRGWKAERRGEEEEEGGRRDP